MKKFLSVLLATLFIVNAFCACSGSKKEQTATVTFDLKYTYDSAYTNYSSGIIKSYQTLCKAIVNKQSTADINTNYLDEVRQLLYTSFPLYPLIKDIQENTDGYGVKISYKNNTATHIKKVNAFNKKVKSIMATCKSDTTNDMQYAINVYNYVATHIKPSTDDGITCYDAIINDKGSSFTYSNMFEYLLLQRDISACHIIANDAKGAAWGLSLVILNDGSYYMDPMTEYYSNQGAMLDYFGMTTKDVKAEGLSSMKYSSDADVDKISSDYFTACRNSTKWSVSGDKLTLSYVEGKDKTVTLK